MKNKGGRPKHRDSKYGANPNAEVMTVEEVANYLRVYPQTIRYMIRDGFLAAFKVGQQYRILRADLDKLKDR